MSEAKIRISAVDATAAGIGSAKARLGQLAAEGAALGDRFTSLAGALSALAAGGALGALLKNTVDGIDALNDLADATGSSVENLSALEDAARRTGTGLDVVGSALIKLNKTIADAKPGSEAAAALNAIGLSAKELAALDPADALLRVAQGLAAFNDDGNKARLTQELFGKSLRDVAPLLKDLVERGQLNATVTREQAEAVDTFKKRAAELQKTLTDLARNAVGPIVEAINAMAVAFRGVDVDFEQLSGTAQAIAVPFQALAVLGANVAFVFRGVGREVGILAAQAQALATQGLSAAAEIGKAAREEAAAARKDLDEFERRILGIGRSTSAASKSARDLLRGIEAGSATRPTAPAPAGKAEVSEFEKYIRRLQDAQLATVELTEVEKTRIAINKGELGKLTQQQKDYALAIAQVNDALRARKAPDVLGEFLAQLPQRDLDKALSLAEQSAGARLEALEAAQRNVREQFDAGRLSATDYGRALEVLAERMRSLEDNSKGISEKLGQLNEDVRDVAWEIQGAFGTSLLAAMEGNSRKIDRIWGDLLRRMVAQAASAKLVETLFGKGFTGSGQLGGLFGSLVGFVGGGGTSSAGSSAGTTNSVFSDVVKNSSAAGLGKSQASAQQPQVVQNVYVQGDVGAKSRRAMLGVAAQIQARQTRAAVI